MSQQQPAPWVRKLAADGGLLLLDTASNCLSAYNSTAQLVWELLEQGGPETELVAGFAVRCGIAHDVACKDVRAIIRQWRSQGLVSNGSSKRSTKRWKSPARTDWSQVPTPHWVGTLTCTIRSTVFAFAIEPANLIDFVPIFFKHLARYHPPPTRCCSLQPL
jgi:Coenzyme PQQ synthesis protein D (PqqD)